MKKHYAFYDRYSGEYITEVLAESEEEACQKVDNLSITELVILSENEPLDSLQYRIRNSTVKHIPHILPD